jgi:O-acetyl-ADP-ribose deacetylase (regulator of RNase III)
MIKEIQDNLFKSHADIIVHGCNAQGKMGSGIAKQIRDIYPKVYDAYIQVYESKGLKLGDIIPVSIGNRKWIVNAITQEFYGYDDRLYTDYDAIRECMKKIAHNAQHGFKIAMPKIGCGLGGGDWNKVKKIIEEELCGFEVEVYYF